MAVFVTVGIVFLLTMGYFFLMIFFPEWVGMSGDDTRKVLESHKDETGGTPAEGQQEGETGSASEIDPR